MYIPASSPGSAGVYRGHHADGKEGTGWSSIIGIVTAICGNVLISFALNTQRYAHIRLEAKARAARKGSRENKRQDYGTTADDDQRPKIAQSTSSEESDPERQSLIPKLGSRKTSSSTSSDTYVEDEKDDEQASKSYLKSGIWWLGISMMIVGEAGNFLAYGFAPASVVSPLGVVALVSNCLIAPLLLHEEFRLRDGVGVLIAIAGAVTVVLSASGSNPKLDPEDIWELITQWEFETYLGVTVALIIALMIASNKFGEKSVLIDLGLVGLFGGYTALSTKGVASLLSNKIWRVFTYPITYLLIPILVGTAVMQIKYVNRALQRFNSTVVIPTQFVLFTISVIVGSAVLYRDFEKQSIGDALKFFGGCALTFLGVWCITSGRSSGNDDDHDDDQTEEEDDEDDEQTKEDVEPGHDRPRKPRLSRSHLTDDAPQLLVTSPTNTSHITGKQLDKTLLASVTPANRSAIHPDLAIEASSSSDAPPPLHATTSAPVIPTLKSSTPVLEPQVGSVPTAHRLSPSMIPQTPGPPAGQPRLLSRHSIVDLLPGPFMSPLSSSLAAIVADSLRKGTSPAHSQQQQRARTMRLSRWRTGESEHQVAAGPSSSSTAARNHAANKRRSIDSADLDFAQDDDGTTARSGSVRGSLSVQSKGGRMRSFSATLGDFFSPGQRRQKDEPDRAR